MTGSDGGRNTDGGSRDQGEVSTAEKALTVVSVAFTVLVFGYVAWHAVKPPSEVQPKAEVVGTERAANGSVLVYVRFTSPGDSGLLSATVEADCERPPPEVVFENVPAGGREQGVLVCPPGTTNPNVSVSSWIPA